jgi:hypothetical protein
VSQRAVSDLERGINRTARKDTALLLAGALNLTGQVRELFVAAARGQAPPTRCWRLGRRGRRTTRSQLIKTARRSVPRAGESDSGAPCSHGAA